MIRAMERLAAIAALFSFSLAMETADRLRLRDQVKNMFYHGYNSYMEFAFPADELMPLTCKGRYRGVEENRGDIDDAMGNFSLTLVDSADTLMIMGQFADFEKAVKLIIENVRLDNDVTVSVFETNIRMLGGLLSNHILSRYLKESLGKMTWYNNELLLLAKDLGLRLLPSFNSTTGIPHPRVNLRWGMKSTSIPKTMETCTACAGTMLLEFAALSRLTGEPLFEAKARKAMDYLWLQRHRSSDLVGTVINVNSGDWIRRDSGVGAGIDSYYEYCLKAYILLGDKIYLDRFNKHYAAVMKYISQGPMLVDVHMHRPNTNSKNFMDALLAFWPGLQVLKGDIKPAIETHEMLYQVMQRHNFLPEAFTTDFQVHWGQHPLRPEFIESTYFIYRATNDPYYLEVGRKVVESLEKYARVSCGFAAVKDVRTNSKDDRMDSFVLAETFKYLYLLFADKSDVPLDIDQFVFTTEAHLLPLILSRKGQSNVTLTGQPNVADTAECPNSDHTRNADKIRLPLKNLVEGTCPSQPVKKRRLLAAQFDVTNSVHVELIRQMGVLVAVLGDGRMQLVHNTAYAATLQDAQEGLLFMQEMIQLAKNQNRQEQAVRSVQFMVDSELFVVPAGPAQFGPDLGDIANQVSGTAEWVEPLKACSPVFNCPFLRGKVAIMERGECMFIEKARNVERCGAIGGIVLDTAKDSSAKSASLFAMSGDGGQNDPAIPIVFVFSVDAKPLLDALKDNPNLQITLADATPIAPLVEAESGEKRPLVSDSTVRSTRVRALRDLFNGFLLETRKLKTGQMTERERERRFKKLLMDIKSSLRTQKIDLRPALGEMGIFTFDDEVDMFDPQRSPNPNAGARSFLDFITNRQCLTSPAEEREI